MNILDKDRDILRGLAEKVAKIAALDVHKEKAGLWTKLNDLKKTRPLVWVTEQPWHEMDVEGELKLHCSDPHFHSTEWALRATIYQWEHMPADMVVEPVFYTPMAVQYTGLGLSTEADLASESATGIVSRHYKPQIKDEADIEKIKPQQVSHNQAATEESCQILGNVFGDILPVEKRGVSGVWFAPWDILIQWWGVQEALTDLVLKPELVHLAMDRLMSAMVSLADQYNELNLWASNNANVRVGSGGLGYTDQLPSADHDSAQVKPIDMWGCATAQIFSEVSPEMHEEFALNYELRWLEKFGLNYYGCCEPLHHKIGMLKKVPRLRKISISPWAKLDEAVKEIGTDYVISLKPNPAILAGDDWDLGKVRADLKASLEKTRGCHVEIIMKDISTVRNQPQRLWEWAEMACEVAEEFAG